MNQALPVSVDLSAYRGDSWEQSFRFLHGQDPIDLSLATVKSEARNANGVRITLVTVITDPLDGAIVLRLPPELTPGSYVYDIEVSISGTVTTWVRGTLGLARDVTNELT